MTRATSPCTRRFPGYVLPARAFRWPADMLPPLLPPLQWYSGRAVHTHIKVYDQTSGYQADNGTFVANSTAYHTGQWFYPTTLLDKMAVVSVCSRAATQAMLTCPCRPPALALLGKHIGLRKLDDQRRGHHLSRCDHQWQRG